MELAIILVVVGIIGYVIYESLPAPKFQKANSLLEAGNLIEAKTIFNSIFNHHPSAPYMLAECILREAQKAKVTSDNSAIQLFNDIIEVRNRLPQNAKISKYEAIEAKAYFEIATIQYKNSLAVSNVESKIRNLKGNLNFIETAKKSDIESDFNLLRKKHLADLGEIYFGIGIKYERENNFYDAITYYSDSKEFSIQSSNSKLLYNSVARIGISKLKNREFVEPQLLEYVSKSSIEYKKDFYFRYARKLLNEKEYIEAEKIISLQLNFSSLAIDKLKNVLVNKKIEDAIVKVNEINSGLDQLYENSFPVYDVKNLYEKIDLQIDEIRTVLPELTKKLQDLKPSLFNRLLTHYIVEEKYGNAIALIQKYPRFWENPELLKNLGICCYGFTLQGNVSEKNYRTVISNWLTAVYSDKVILKSLEETSWDDQFTFTLRDAVGSNYNQYSSLPENVNYDEITESNISIGATQRELLQQFETLLHHLISDSTLAKNAIDFYEEEKEALECIISIIANETIFATPTFAKVYGINNEIIEELENDFIEYGNEDTLKAGVPYVITKSESSVGKYAQATSMVKKLLLSIKNENLILVKEIVRDNNKYLIEEFETISTATEDSIFYAFNEKINDDDENENLVQLMAECIDFTENNAKLKFQYSNYVSELCIAKVNSDEFDNFKALQLMSSAYYHLKENSKICKTIITLIRYNLNDIIGDRTNKSSEIFKILDSVKNNRSEAFISNSSELFEERKVILNQLRDAGIDLTEITGTTSYNLTSNGIKLKKALKYMEELNMSFRNTDYNLF